MILLLGMILLNQYRGQQQALKAREGLKMKDLVMGAEARVVEVETETSRRVKAQRANRFLVIRDWDDLAIAAKLGGKALALFLLIHHRQTLTKKKRVTLSSSMLAELGVGPDAKLRGLQQLAKAGLIRVHRANGRPLAVETVTRRHH
jgi:hypothetical protein